jgi:hypothetical protein
MPALFARMIRNSFRRTVYGHRQFHLSGVRAFAVVACTAACMVVHAPAYAKPNPSGISDAEARRFLAAVKGHVGKNNSKGLAALVAYPASLNVGKSRQKIENAGDFTRRYSKIVTPTVREKILAQEPAKLFHRADGVMMGDGEVWFRTVCTDEKCTERSTRIVTFNVPIEVPAAAAEPSTAPPAAKN